MMALPPLPTTKYGPNADEFYRLLKPWPKDSNSLEQLMKQLPLDTLEISSKIMRDGKYRMVQTKCKACNREKFSQVENILSGRTRGCTCRRLFKFPEHKEQSRLLLQRFVSIKQRCNNQRCEEYRNYGARGIRNEFKTSHEFVQYVLTNLPHPTYKGVDVGRKDNNGNYAPGNIQLESRSENLRNRRTNHRIDYKGEQIVIADLYALLKRDYPQFSLAQKTTYRLASQNIPWREILLRVPRGSYRSTTS